MTRQRLTASLAAVILAAAIPFGAAAWLGHGPAHYTGLDAMRSHIVNVDRSLGFFGVTLQPSDAATDPPISQSQAEATVTRARAAGAARGSALVRFTWQRPGVDGGAPYSCLCWIVDLGVGVSPSRGPAPAPGTSFYLIAIDALTGYQSWDLNAG